MITAPSGDLPIKITSEAQANRMLGAMRRYAGMRQSELAAKAHVSVSAVRDREHGRRGLHVEALVATAGALGFDVVLVPREPKEQP